jgi:hypothetical protein
MISTYSLGTSALCSLSPPVAQTQQRRDEGGQTGSGGAAPDPYRLRFDVEDCVALGAVHVLEADLADEMLPVVGWVCAVCQFDVVGVYLLNICGNWLTCSVFDSQASPIRTVVHTVHYITF